MTAPEYPLVTFRMSGQAWEIVEAAHAEWPEEWKVAHQAALPIRTGRGYTYWVKADIRAAIWLLGLFERVTDKGRNKRVIVREAITRLRDAIDGWEAPYA